MRTNRLATRSSIVTLLLLSGGLGGCFIWSALSRQNLPLVRPVPPGDQEIAWLHMPTAYETWDNFLRGLKRVEFSGAIPHLYVDDSRAYPQRTTAVPEVVVGRSDRAGRLHFRWYKVTDTLSQSRWMELLLQRSPPPLAVIAGWSSDRAVELAEVLRSAPHPHKPALLLTAATAEQIAVDVSMTGPAGPRLIAIYDKTFRFCFSNRQMAEALTDFLLNEPSLRPQGGIEPLVLAIGTAHRDPAAALAALWTPEVPAFAIDWQDDPYSLDLSFHLRYELNRRTPATLGAPRLVLIRSQIPFSTGPIHQPNAAESDAVLHILQHLPPPPQRTLLLLPTVTAPARRVLRALAQEQSEIGEQIVAVIGDGITVNTLFRDREVAWPISALSIPVVLFTHADPCAWDPTDNASSSPSGYALPTPAAGELRSTTEDIEHFRRLCEVLLTAAYRDEPAALAEDAEQLCQFLRTRQCHFFDTEGNRRGGSGEHIVVLRPSPSGATDPTVEGTLEVYTRRDPRESWHCLHRRILYRLHYDRSR